MEFLKNFLKGVAISISQIVPGVSGGTIAMILGIYDKLLHAVNNIIKDFKNKGSSWEINMNNIWSLLVFSFVLSKIDCDNVKFTLPIDDWAFCLAIAKLQFGVTALEQNRDINQLLRVIELLNSDLSEINESFWIEYQNSRNLIINNYNSMDYNVLEDLNQLLN